MLNTPGIVTSPIIRLLGRAVSSIARSAGFSTIRYPTLNLKDRLQQFERLELNLKGSTEIRFNNHLVPYITAQSDQQAAYALGCVTEFLRGPQIQFLKRLAEGRLSEMGSSRYVDMDHLIRILGFGRAIPQMLETMPEETRNWIQAFVDGLNCVQGQRKRGLDEKWMGIKPEPYTLSDVLLLGRLAGSDVNWPMYFSLLECAEDGEATQWWQRFGGSNLGTEVAEMLTDVSRSGSNCFAVAGSRTETGQPLLAGDPHLGQHLPNIWMIVGLNSPSLQCVGLMFPGAPVLGMGRNNDLAWGGTNLRAASSDLVHIQDLAKANARTETTHIKVRFGFGRKRTLIQTDHGPLLNASTALTPMLRGRQIAMRWTGHWATDEVSAFLGLMKSSNVREAHNNLGTMGVTPLNILTADTQGNINHTLATTLPAREAFDHRWLLDEETSKRIWDRRVNAHSLPSYYNPAEGFLVSTNNKPEGSRVVSFYFNGGERQQRAVSLLGNLKTISLHDLLKVQSDTTSPKACELAFKLSEWLEPFALELEHKRLREALAQWTGSYASDNVSCLCFETMVTALVGKVSSGLKRQQALALMEEWGYLTEHLLDDLSQLSDEEQAKAAGHALNQADLARRQWNSWGSLHKVRPRHVLGYVPLLGKLFSSRAIAASGSRETLHKNAHGLVKGYQESAYGSQSRHWSDLSDPDANHFVLLGGQDGWVGSSLMTDQIELWRLGQTIRMPLSRELVEAEFPHRKV